MWNWPENQVRLVLIRHGATEANREHRYLGRSDEELSQSGRAALAKARAAAVYPEVDLLFSSPMKRCLSTAAILYPDQPPVVIPQWTEMDFGDFEGRNYLELKDNAAYQAWIDSNGTLPFPNGESREQFERRCQSGFYEMLDRLPPIVHNTTIGMIVHGGTIMSVMSRFCGGDYFDYQIPNGGGYLCELLHADTRITLRLLKQL